MHPTFSRTILLSALILAGVDLSPEKALGQTEMKDMPGMAPKSTPQPAKVTPSATPMPSAAPMKMEAMPGMAPESTPKPTAPERSSATKSRPEMDSMPGMNHSEPAKGSKSSANPKEGMAGMPGMAHRQPSPKHEMAGMPEMGAGQPPSKKAMGAMPGMTDGRRSSKNDMAGMPGMAQGGDSAPMRVSTPGVTILRPAQKWVPPRGDNRAAELMSRPMLEAHLREGMPSPVMDTAIHSFALAEILEYRFTNEGADTLRWDVYGWIGGDYNRLWIKSEGSQEVNGATRGEGDLQLLYGRLIAPFWDFQAGVRTQQTFGAGSRDSRSYAVIGVQGTAPYLLDLEPSLFVSDRGDISARVTLNFDLLLTQKLVLQPRFEANAALQSDEKMGVGRGLNDTDLGLRLRYEIRRELAPYLGISWVRRYGESARFAEREGDGASVVSFVAGLRFWF